jgi:hypothetical protein
MLLQPAFNPCSLRDEYIILNGGLKMSDLEQILVGQTIQSLYKKDKDISEEALLVVEDFKTELAQNLAAGGKALLQVLTKNPEALNAIPDLIVFFNQAKQSARNKDFALIALGKPTKISSAKGKNFPQGPSATAPVTN